jgi:RimJ/RimL family protein N-acetyltransferase
MADLAPREPPPYRIQTERMVLRCWDPADAPLLGDAVESSLDHLRPWMPWASEEPRPLEETVALLRRFRGLFDLGQDFLYGIFARDESEVLGGTGFHARIGESAFEIGYWIRASRVGEGLGTEATAALTRVGFELCGLDRIEIHVDPANEASAKIPLRLGYTHEATLRRRLEPVGGSGDRRDARVYTMFREAFRVSDLAETDVEAFDSVGNRLL